MRPTISALPTIVGRTCGGTRKSSQSHGSHASDSSPMSSVRDAFVASVTWTLPAVRRDTRKLSIVPNASSPASARARAPGVSSSSHASFVPEKYASSTSPVMARTLASCPAARSASHAAAVRRHCHTIAFAMGLSVALSQTTVVSRWFVMPMAAMSAPVTPAEASAAITACSTDAQISRGSCSTHPGWGKC